MSASDDSAIRPGDKKLKEINRQNRRFWETRLKEFSEQIQKRPYLAEIAAEEVQDRAKFAGIRSVPSTEYLVQRIFQQHRRATRRSTISPFDDAAGKLMREVRPMRESNGRLPHAEYKKIAAALDIRGFKLLDCLEHRCHKLLAEWNQKHPRNAVVTFQAAIEGKLNWLHRGVQKRLNRAEATYSKLSAR